jgi:predicted GIY-YIG superfamily endonuclease
MPRKDIDYSKCIIYKIVCNDFNVKDIYVGHTTDLIKRRSMHKYTCINENVKQHNLKIYKIIRENGGWEIGVL